MAKHRLNSFKPLVFSLHINVRETIHSWPVWKRILNLISFMVMQSSGIDILPQKGCWQNNSISATKKTQAKIIKQKCLMMLMIQYFTYPSAVLELQRAPNISEIPTGSRTSAKKCEVQTTLPLPYIIIQYIYT